MDCGQRELFENFTHRNREFRSKSQTHRVTRQRNLSHQFKTALQNIPWTKELIEQATRGDAKPIYRGYSGSYRASHAFAQRWREVVGSALPENAQTTNPDNDGSFPDLNSEGQDAQYNKLASQIFYAINDWTKIDEWAQVVTVEQRKELSDAIYDRRGGTITGATHEELRPSDADLAGILPEVGEQHRRMMNAPFPPPWEMEVLAGDILNAAVDAQQGKVTASPYSSADMG